MEASVSTLCPACATQIAVSLLTCPSCNRLVHADNLKLLALDAQRAQDGNDLSTAISLWRQALDLLPRNSQQYQTIATNVAALSKELDRTPATKRTAPTKTAPASGKHPWQKGAAGTSAAVLLLWKLKFFVLLLLTKGKLLVLGLTNLPTLLTMILSLGAYWAAWGWKFALGLVLSIYVHEMGHIAALRRFGFQASAPMFVPGLGALIRLKQQPVSALEDARIGLAGPVWGLGAAIVAAIIWLITGSPIWAAIAQIGAWINLFNLLPIWQLDGGRGFRALSRTQAWLLVIVIAAMWFVTSEGMLMLILIVAAVRALSKTKENSSDTFALSQYAILIVILSLMTRLPTGLAKHPNAAPPQSAQPLTTASDQSPSPRP